jgi:SMC interacting uncharacterized protein involved in chromosome segregation
MIEENYMSSSMNNDIYIQSIIEKQRILLEARNKDLINLKKKLAECQTTINEKDYYLSKLEMDLEHAIGQCKQIAAAKHKDINQWINRSEPGLEIK